MTIVQDLDLPTAALVLPRAGLLTTPSDVLAARRLYVSTHLRVGYLDPQVVAPDGTLHDWADPYRDHSRYFGAFDDDGVLQAACRLISNTAPQPLPTLQLPGIDPVHLAELTALQPGRLAEIASLARSAEVGADYVRAVFRALWLDGADRGETAWVLNADVICLRVLRQMDGDLFQVVGPAAPAPVRPVRPVRVQVRDVYDAMFTHDLTIRKAARP